MSVKTFGVVIFNHDLTEVLLVKSVRTGKWSFPKGSKKKHETGTEAAIRELHEETGLKPERLKFFRNKEIISIAEYDKYGYPEAIYLVAKYPKRRYPMVEYYPKEILDIKWFEIDDALDLKNFKESRKNVILQSVKLINF